MKENKRESFCIWEFRLWIVPGYKGSQWYNQVSLHGPVQHQAEISMWSLEQYSSGTSCHSSFASSAKDN